jgi:hypothetical protein
MPGRVGFAAISQRHRFTHSIFSLEKVIKTFAFPHEDARAAAATSGLYLALAIGADETRRRAEAAVLRGDCGAHER